LDRRAVPWIGVPFLGSACRSVPFLGSACRSVPFLGSAFRAVPFLGSAFRAVPFGRSDMHSQFLARGLLFLIGVSGLPIRTSRLVIWWSFSMFRSFWHGFSLFFFVFVLLTVYLLKIFLSCFDYYSEI